MNDLTQLFAQLSRGIELISLVAGASADDLAAMGASPTDARDYAHLWEIYFGATGSTRKQADARDAAATGGLSLEDLRNVERFVSRVRDRNKAWDLRVELCRTEPAQIVRHGRARLKEINPPKEKTPRAIMRRSKGDMWDINITGPSRRIAEIAEALDGSFESFDALVTGDNTPTTTVVTNVVVQLDELDKIVAGDGDDIVLRMTNGATMTGAQFLEEKLADYAYFGIFHPLEGPVNAYRTQRVANFTQRILAGMENPTCAWPDCLCGADDSQVHHIKAFVDGGLTNSVNLAMLCPYHNGVNEDLADIPTKRGKIIRRRGATNWLSPHALTCIPTGMYAAA